MLFPIKNPSIKIFFTFSTFYFAIVLMCCSPEKIHNKTPEEFVQSLFTALCKKDVNKYSQLLPTLEDTKKSFEKLTFSNEIEKNRMLAQLEEETFQQVFNNNLNKLESDFVDFIKLGEEIGIEWDKAKIFDFKFRIRDKKGLEALNGLIILTSKKDKFQFRFDQCTHFNKGWLGAKLYGLKKTS